MPHIPTHTTLTDSEVATLQDQGFREGSFVPNRGILTPSGTFRSPSVGEPGFREQGITDIGAGLESAREQALAIQKSVAELQKNQATDTQTTAITSTDAIVQDERTLAQDIRTFQGPDSNFEALQAESDVRVSDIEAQTKALEERRKAEIEELNRQFDVTKKETEGAQAREKGTFGVALARIGGFLGESASAIGALNNLNAEHRAELASLKSKRASAINIANNAITDKQYALAQEKRDEVRDLEQEIDDRRNTFFDQSLKIIKEQREQDDDKRALQNQIRDDARSALNTVITNFGGIDFASLDEATANDFAQLAALAGIPIESLAQPTIKQTSQLSTEEQRQISNALAAARLQIQEASFNLSLARFAEGEKLNAVDAQRLGLPKLLVGVSENEVEEQLRSGTPPDWFKQIEQNKSDPPTTTDQFIANWEEFRTEILTTSTISLFGVSGIGAALPPAIE